MNKQRQHIIQFACNAALLTAIMLQGFTLVAPTKPFSPYTDNVRVEEQNKKP